MPVYTVHAPVTNGADLTATDKFAFVRDGFHFWAAVAGVIWLAWHRLWLALIGWIVLILALDVGLAALGIGSRTIWSSRGACVAARAWKPRACGAGRCRAASGVCSTSSSPMTKRPPSGVFSIAGPSDAGPTTCRSIAAARRRPAASGPAVPRPPPIPQAASSACFQSQEDRDDGCDHRLRLRESAFRRQSL